MSDIEDHRIGVALEAAYWRFASLKFHGEDERMAFKRAVFLMLAVLASPRTAHDIEDQGLL